MIPLWQLGAGLTATSAIAWWLLDRHIASWLRHNDELTNEISEISKPELDGEYTLQTQKQEGQILLAAVRAASMRAQRYQLLHDPDRFLPELLVLRISVFGIVCGIVLIALGLPPG